MADEPLAYFLTIHTYGTWLPGHEAGSVDREHNTYEQPFASPDSEREAAMRRRMRGEALTLNTAQRTCVFDSCLETCRYREWRVHALHVRTTHVHVVMSATCDPEKVMNDLKSYATRELRRQELTSAADKVWSRHGSTRYLWSEDAVRDKVDYAVNKQGVLLAPLPYVSEEFSDILSAPDDGGREDSEPRQ